MPVLAVLLLTAVVTACGGGGSKSSGGATPPPPPSNQAPVFEAGNSPGVQFTAANGTTAANYAFAGIHLNSPIGYSVGNVLATDANSDSISYNISGGTDDSALFKINPTTGEITLKAQAANLAEYQFNAIASDGKGGSATATISATVLDPTPPVFTSTFYNFDLLLSAANAPGVVLGNVSAMDAEGTLFNYSLASNENLDSLFELTANDNADGTRNITLRRAAILSDFATSSVTFHIMATHQIGGTSSNAAITVNLDLQLDDDYDGDGIKGFYDAFPHDEDVNVTGNGESGNPYIISNIYQLQAIAGVDHNGTALDASDFTNNSFLYGTDAADQLTKHYILANDIDASPTNNTEWNKPEIGTDKFVGRGWTPIAGKSGESFNGSFNGDGYTINELTIHLRQGDNSRWFGLFGINNGNITALGLQNINMIIQAPGNHYDDESTSPLTIINSGSHAGGLVGWHKGDGIISYSYATGLVNASMDSIGGLLGVNQGKISYSYSTATVQGAGDTGGLVGTNEGGALLSSYATGDVRGSVGIKDRGGNAGGLAGSISGGGAIINTSYATGRLSDPTPSGDSRLGGLVAERGNGITIDSSYWDSTTTEQSIGVGGIRGSSNSETGDQTGTTTLTTTAQLKGCGLGGVVISGASPVPTCAGLFPSADWGDNTDSVANISRGWIFNAGEYPSLSAVRSSDNKQLFPSAADQECQRNGRPSDCYKIGFSVVSGLVNQFTVAFGATFASYSFAGIPHNSNTGYLVGNVSATNANNDAITYSINGGTNDINLFQINPTTGEITLKTTAVNTGDLPITYIFNIIASNGKGGTTTATVYVEVLPNQPPVFLAVSGSASQFTAAAGATPANYSFAGIPLSSPANYSVGSVLASDVNNDAITYNISGDADVDALFKINATTGEITLKAAAANAAVYLFNTIASDGKGASAIATISVTVDDTPPVFNPMTYEFDLSLSEANATGVVVGKVLAVDAEGTLFDYSLERNNNIFEPASADNADGTRSIILSRAATLSDFAAYSITFQVVAEHTVGGISSMAEVTVNLINDDDSDEDGIKGLYDAFPEDATMNVTGSGNSSHPYIISNIYQLQAIAGVDHAGMPLDSSSFTNNSFLYGTNASDQLTKHYKLANDIGASVTGTGAWNKILVDADNFNGKGWIPIAGKSDQSFSGSFNGEGYAINSLTSKLRQDNNSRHFGLFGINNGSIIALGLQGVNIGIQASGNMYTKSTTIDNITSGTHAGVLVGLNQEDGIISYSYATGLVNASLDAVGGLVGLNQGEISYSYSTTEVKGEGDSGGLVGANEGGAILSSYAIGAVDTRVGIIGRNGTAGGLAGSISGEGAIINSSYATGSVTDVEGDLGSLGFLVAERGNGVTIESSYWFNNSAISDDVGVGKNRADIAQSGDTTGTTGLTVFQLLSCELDGMVIEGVSSAPTCTDLFPSSDWGNNTDSSVVAFNITRGWIFNAGEYPILSAVRSSDNKQLLPSAAQQNCQRRGMQLGCE